MFAFGTAIMASCYHATRISHSEKVANNIEKRFGLTVPLKMKITIKTSPCKYCGRVYHNAENLECAGCGSPIGA